MPNYIRPRTSGATVFFTVNLADRSSTLLTERIDVLRNAVRLTQTERPFQIDAWVVLPDHMHCIWTLPTADGDYATRWRLIKSRFSMSVPMGPRRPSHVKRDERGLWQRRFWEHHIRNDEDFQAHLDYCWFNPVKHGYADDPAGWPFSSFARRAA